MLKRGISSTVFRGFRGKRGFEHSLWTIVEIVLVIMIVVSMFFFIKGVKENRFFERSALSKDTALLVDTIQSVPGDVLYTYTHSGIDMSRYQFNFDKYKVIVKDTDSVLKNTYPYYNDDALADAYTVPIDKPGKIQFMKTSGELKIGQEIVQDFGRRSCRKRDSSQEEIKFIQIVYTDSKLEQVANRLRDFLLLPKRIDSTVNSFVDVQNTIVDNRIVLSQNIDMLLVLSIGADDDTGRIPVIAYYSNDESMKLACFITNKYIDDAGWVTDVSIKQDKGNIFLPSDRKGVLLEIGNSNSGVFDITKSDLVSSIVRSTSSGIKKYGESGNEA